MTVNDKILNLLTMCRKSGRIVFGFDSVKESITDGKARLVLIASDTSAKTEKEVRFFADKNGTETVNIGISIDEIGLRTGKRAAVIAICDDGFAGGMRKLLSESLS
ncbi:MAG: ribosomal L7Ae/L30e/S12e/Gadd45 family protein [Oscillospiraceae bacterium]|nr:ribosomal L7Ae/L30e/S12e/Gadd45 family protein [Oscillospiraceae bacterium]